MKDQVMRMNSIKKSSKSELSSRFFGRLKFLVGGSAAARLVGGYLGCRLVGGSAAAAAYHLIEARHLIKALRALIKCRASIK